MSPQITCLASLNGRICKEVRGCTQSSLISYNLQLACVRKLEANCPDARIAASITLNGIMVTHSYSHLCKYRAARAAKK